MTETVSVEGAAPARRPAKRWAGAGLGLAVALGLGAWALRRGPAPEPFRQRVNAMAQDLIRDQWTAMRRAVEQLGTDDGAKAFFASHPGLSSRVPSESAFLELARSWRSLLQPLPEGLPGLETHDLSYVKQPDRTEMRYRVPNGACIFMKWSEDRLVEMRVY